jgi:outer membrane protein assembly factor BamB
MAKITDAIKKLSGKKTGSIEKKWAFEVNSQILSSPVVGDIDQRGDLAIVFGTKAGEVYMLDENSQVKWVYNIKEDLSPEQMLFMDEDTLKSIYGTPKLVDINKDNKKEVIFGSDIGKLYVLDANGKLIWDFKARDAIRTSPVVEDINNDFKFEIIFGSKDKFLYVVSNEGKLIWKFEAESGIESTPCVIKDKKGATFIVFGSNDGIVYALNEHGDLIWKFAAKGKITAQPIVGDLYGDGSQFIIVGSYDNTLYVLDTKGSLEWKFPVKGRIVSAATLADVNKDGKLEILFGACDNNVYCLTAKGSKIWSYETDFWIVSSPIVIDIDDDGRLEVIVGSYDQSVYILDAEGSFLLNYMPGVSGAAQQLGQNVDIITSEPGQYVGKKLWQFKTDGMIVGGTYLDSKKKKNLILGIKTGKLDDLIYNPES